MNVTESTGITLAEGIDGIIYSLCGVESLDVSAKAFRYRKLSSTGILLRTVIGHTQCRHDALKDGFTGAAHQVATIGNPQESFCVRV
jgi:hypothetical protein